MISGRKMKLWLSFWRLMNLQITDSGNVSVMSSIMLSLFRSVFNKQL